MKAVVELSKEEYQKLSVIRENIIGKIKGLSHEDMWDEYEKKYGYAHYKFTVKPSEKMIAAIGREPTTDEMIIIVDGGFSHFGASCSEYKGTYTGQVNTD